MAKQVRTIINYIDDLTGDLLPEGDGQTITYSLDGKHYEIDLSNENAESLRTMLRPLIEKSRKAGTPSKAIAAPQRPAAPRELPEAGNGVGLAYLPRTKREGHAFRREIRQWANSNGFFQAESGRIKEEVVDAWNKAHPDRPFVEGL